MLAVEFEPAWNVSRYAEYDARPAAPTMPRRYPDEKAAERALKGLLSPYFELYPQVRITETGYPPQFIDYIAVLPGLERSATLPFFGIEVKRGFDDIKGACAAIRQAMRYRKARIADQRLSAFLGDRIPYIFLWPRFDWCIGTEWTSGRPNAEVVAAEYRARCAGGALALTLFAQHWNVGHVEIQPWWSSAEGEWKPGIVLMNGQQQVWTSRYYDGLVNGFRGGAALASDPKRGLRYLE